MGKRTYLKFEKGCKITKVVRKGETAKVTMKCGNKKINKTLSAQEIIDG